MMGTPGLIMSQTITQVRSRSATAQKSAIQSSASCGAVERDTRMESSSSGSLDVCISDEARPVRRRERRKAGSRSKASSCIVECITRCSSPTDTPESSVEPELLRTSASSSAMSSAMLGLCALAACLDGDTPRATRKDCVSASDSSISEGAALARLNESAVRMLCLEPTSGAPKMRKHSAAFERSVSPESDLSVSMASQKPKMVSP
mmetsp:Transcript_40926/g.101018  ORF Transcript_40926/g.101018 Transcript_40926/m.101018 type:complete len:206 (-) Transcript_40926:2009-2626(-)